MKGYWKRDNRDRKMRQVYKTTDDIGRVEERGANSLFPLKNQGSGNQTRKLQVQDKLHVCAAQIPTVRF